MDLQSITWVGHMYQKFEAMCLEVEEIMYEDTVKFVENQVETVSTNVKRFYSDVMQDLADPSLEEPAKKAVSDLPTKQRRDFVTHKIPKVEAEARKFDVGGTIKKNSKQLGNSDTNRNCKPSLELISREDNLCQPSGNELSKETKLPLTESSEVIPVNKHLGGVSSLPELPNVELEAWHDHQITSSPISDEFTGIDSVRESFYEIKNAGEVATSENNVLFVSNTGQSEERPLDMMSSAVLDMEATQELDPVDVEESCHIVNGAELPIILQKEKKHKMRIPDVFSSRMRSSRKQEYKQLAISYGENGKSMEKNSPSGTISESEWEIL